MQPVAVFDFDETLIRENSLGMLFKTASGRKRLWPLAFMAILGSLFWKKGPRIAIKHRLYKLCLGGLKSEKLYAMGEQVASEFTPVAEVQKALWQLHEKGSQIWVVTASPELFIKGLINRLNLPVQHVLGTRLPSSNGFLTGDLINECSGSEKVKRIKQQVNENSFRVTLQHGYGNLPYDLEMLALVKHAFVVRKGVSSAFTFDK